MSKLRKGTYCLILKLDDPDEIQVGKLGCFEFQKGFYGYVGSELGPGGLTARLKHHLKPVRKPHWHIDYFRYKAVVIGIRAEESEISLEHRWASILEGTNGAMIPVPKFNTRE